MEAVRRLPGNPDRSATIGLKADTLLPGLVGREKVGSLDQRPNYGVCLEAAFVFVSFLGKVAGKVAVWIGNWVTNKEELALLVVVGRCIRFSCGGMRKGVESMKSNL